MTLNGIMAVTLRYFTEVGKHALQKTICGGLYAIVYCIFSACTMSSQTKFTFAISSPAEFLVLIGDTVSVVCCVVTDNDVTVIATVVSESLLSVLLSCRHICFTARCNRAEQLAQK